MTEALLLAVSMCVPAEPAAPPRVIASSLADGPVLGAPQPLPATSRRYFETDLSWKDVELAGLMKQIGIKAPFPIEGRLTATAHVAIPFDAATDVKAFRLKGNATLVRSRIAGIELAEVRADVRLDDGVLTLTDVKAVVAGGSINGQAQLTLGGDRAFEVKAVAAGLDVAALTHSLAEFPVPITGHVSGWIDVSASARGMEGVIALEAPRLRIKSVPTQAVHGVLNYKAGQIVYTVDGCVLGGKFKAEGKAAATNDKDRHIESNGRLQVEGLRLSRLGDVFGQGFPDAGGLKGTLTADLPYSHTGPNFWPVGTGRLVLRGLCYGERIMAEEIGAYVRLTDRQLQIRDIEGFLGEGVLRGGISLYLRDRDRSHFSLHLDHVEATRLLAPFPALADQVHGPVEADLRGTLNGDWQMTGTVVLAHGSFLGVGITEWRLPIDLAFVPREGNGHLQIRDSVAQIASGRANGELRVSWGADTRLRGSVRFLNADFQGLTAQAGSLRGVALGSVSGTFLFGSANLRSVDDLTGVLDANLARSQALELPVLNVLVPFLSPGHSALTFEQGLVHARLNHGTFAVQRLALMSPALKMVIEGNIGLTGRLDLAVTAQTDGFNLPGLGLLATQVPVVGPIPLVVVARVVALLGKRIIHAQMTGTVSNPIVQVATVPFLTDEAVRILLLGYGLPFPSESLP